MTRFSLAGVAALLIATGLAVGETGAASAAVPVWTPATAVSAPSGTSVSSSAAMTAISCSAAGTCTAVGSYDKDGVTMPMASSQTSGGGYPAATGLALPSSRAGATVQSAQLQAVSCTGPGDCVAAGQDTDASGASNPIIATQSSGTWGTPGELALPVNARTGSAASASLGAVSCWSAGNCVATGAYENLAGDEAPMVVSQTGGGAWRITQLPGTLAGASLDAVSCTSSGTCAVGGSETTTNGTQPFVVSDIGGDVGTPQSLGVPSDGASGGDASVTGISCPAAGSCTAIGEYESSSSAEPQIAWTQGAAGFGAPVTLTAPANAAPSPDLTDDSVSCAAAGDCTTTGTYSDGFGIQDAAATQTDGSWGSATQLQQPAGALDVATVTSPVAVSCSEPDVCGAAGGYTAGPGNRVAPMVLSVHQSLGIATTSLPTATVGTRYSAPLAVSGGAGTDAWSLASGVLPAGLQLDPGTGVISGTPMTPETLSFAIGLSDSVSDTPVTAPFQIRVIGEYGRTKLSRVTVKGLAVHATASCAGAASQVCAGRLRAQVKEVLHGRRVVSIGASRRPAGRRPRRRVRRIVLASVRYSLPSGQTQALTLHLDGQARRLLALHHHYLGFALILSAAGPVPATRTRRLALGHRPRVTHQRHHPVRR